MKTILDYLEVAHQSFVDDPFNDLDAVVLARFSYLPFGKIKFSRAETIFSATNKMRFLKSKDFELPDDKKLLRLIAASPRFKNLKLTHLKIKASEKTVEQFSAVTIHLNSSELFVSFTGTDNTLNGWREDCNMAILDEIPSQKTGKNYLRHIMMRYPGKKFRLGGHSKGGNIAMYAAVSLRDAYQKNILGVYSLDGPGLSKELAKKDTGYPILPYIKNFVPQGSIVGRLFSHAETTVVIKSNAKNFLQHDIYSWEVDLKNKRLTPAKLTKSSDFLNSALTRWMDDIPTEQKIIFVDTLFKVLENSDLGTPQDIARSSATHVVPQLFKSYRTLDRGERQTILTTAKKFIDSVVKTYKKWSG